jgi:hypothetical protein
MMLSLLYFGYIPPLFLCFRPLYMHKLQSLQWTAVIYHHCIDYIAVQWASQLARRDQQTIAVSQSNSRILCHSV